MRWVFFCLISFNVVYFAWMKFGAEAESASSGGSAESLEVAGDNRLVLLRELLPEAGSAVPPPTINRAGRFASPSTPKSASVEVPGDGVEAFVEVVAEPRPVVEEAQPVVEEVQPVVETAEVVEAFGSSAVEGAVEEVGVVVEAPAMDRVCASLGPFVGKEDAKGLADQVSSQGLSIKVREESFVAAIDNWVLLPAKGTQKDALRLLRELQSNKIDSYLVTEGEFRNAISLGLFKRSSSAQGVLEKMLSAGYEAEIHQIERKKLQYWVAVYGEYEAGKAQEMLTQLVDDREKIKISESLCEMFASHP